MSITFRPPLVPPPCPVHSSSDPGAEVELVIEIPYGYLAIIGRAESVAMYADDSIECMPALPVSLEHPVQLIIVMAPIDGEWAGEDIEPLRGGAFALTGGVVIERNSCWHVCLYNERLDCHTVMANWTIPGMN